MKATELMIGDWANSRIEGNGKVTRIDRDGYVAITYGNQQNAVVCKSYDLQPIPLTTEILEKNGFEFDGEIYKLGDYQLVIEYRGGFLFGWVFCCRKQLNYVHELQHALRLCGIEKEIEL